MIKSKKVVILQSNYIPWKGYFDLLNTADIFIFYDDLQYTTRDWRNRNKIRTPRGTDWLSIPCGNDQTRLICEVELTEAEWQKTHWRKIVEHYSKASCFETYKAFFEEVFLAKQWTNLSELNQYLIKTIASDFLGSTTTFLDSRTYHLKESKRNRIMELLDKVGGVTEYITGPAAKDYLLQEDFDQRNMDLTIFEYPDYPPYRQVYDPFIHEVSIIDLLFNEGEKASRFISSFSTPDIEINGDEVPTIHDNDSQIETKE